MHYPVRTMFVCHNNIVMTKKLVRTGNSDALIITKEMKEMLGVEDEIDVVYDRDKVILRKPLTVREASALSDKMYSKAYKKLAE